jgi:hypothetical protein
MWPLLALIAAEGLFLLWLCQTGRVPRGHDGFQYFSLQYYFLNDAVQTGDAAALWMPYMTHGTVSNWWYVTPAGILPQVYLLLGPVLKSIGFLPLYYLGIWFDLVVLLLGTWLLSRRHFKTSTAAVLACVMVTASTTWAAQTW